MKHKILLSAMLVFIAFTSNAQLRVFEDGNVKLDKYLALNNASLSDSVVLCVNTPQIENGQKRYGVYSSVEALPFPSFMNNGSRNVCVFGHVTPYVLPNTPVTKSGQDRVLLTPFIAATVGLASNGIGIYGATGSSLPSSWNKGSFAGYFEGNVKVSGTLTATTITQTSDARLKTNIKPITPDALDKIAALRPIEFNWQQVEKIFTDDSITIKENYFSKDTDFDRKHYGFIAQEVQKLFPNLVKEDEEGYLSMNYIEIIPLLVQAVHELSNQVNALQQGSVKHTQQMRGEQAILYQNNPNPFSIDTKIDYKLPESTQNATLYIYNMNGLQVAEYPIHSMGEGSIVVTARHLDAGMYLYSLIADGQVIDTKRMILTK